MNTHRRTLDVVETVERYATISVEVPDGKDERFDHLIDSLKQQESFFVSADEVRDSVQRFYGTKVTLERYDEGEPVNVEFEHYL